MGGLMVVNEHEKTSGNSIPKAHKSLKKINAN